MRAAPGDARPNRRSDNTALRRRVELCGVFVNPPADEIAQQAEELGLSLLQLHGDEGPSSARRPRGAPGRG